MNQKQRNESWANMKLHLANVALDVVEADPANLNTLNKCHAYIEKNFDIMACVKQIDSRTKEYISLLLDDKEYDIALLNRRIDTKSKALCKQQEVA